MLIFGKKVKRKFYSYFSFYARESFFFFFFFFANWPNFFIEPWKKNPAKYELFLPKHWTLFWGHESRLVVLRDVKDRDRGSYSHFLDHRRPTRTPWVKLFCLASPFVSFRYLCSRFLKILPNSIKLIISRLHTISLHFIVYMNNGYIFTSCQYSPVDNRMVFLAYFHVFWMNLMRISIANSVT